MTLFLNVNATARCACSCVEGAPLTICTTAEEAATNPDYCSGTTLECSTGPAGDPPPFAITPGRHYADVDDGPSKVFLVESAVTHAALFELAFGRRPDRAGPLEDPVAAALASENPSETLREGAGFGEPQGRRGGPRPRQQLGARSPVARAHVWYHIRYRSAKPIQPSP